MDLGYGMWTGLKRMPKEGVGAAQRSPQGGGEEPAAQGAGPHSSNH